MVFRHRECFPSIEAHSDNEKLINILNDEFVFVFGQHNKSN